MDREGIKGYRVDFIDNGNRYSIYVDLQDNTIVSISVDGPNGAIKDNVQVSRLEAEVNADGSETPIDVPARVPNI